MKKTVIAFDVDGTLIQNGATAGYNMVPNERIVNLLIVLSKLKNTKIIVWSGAGKEWADEAVATLALARFVSATYDKNYRGIVDGKHVFEPDIVPDIAIDDIHDCALGTVNLIVREK